jgi:phosphoribosylformylglycinamidine synthase
LGTHRIEVRVKPRAGLLDPQGAAVRHALESLGFSGVSDVRVGKSIDLDVEAASASEAVEMAEEMCRKLLANPVTEDFTVGRAPAAQPAGAKP